MDWMERTHGGNFSWTLNELLRAYKDVATITPADYAKLGAEALREIAQDTQDTVSQVP